MAVFMFLSWSPPSLDPDFLAIWYFVVVAVCQWCWENIIIATQAGTVECYPCGPLSPSALHHSTLDPPHTRF